MKGIPHKSSKVTGEMKRVINFSVGKTSGYMTIKEYNPDTDYVVFCDTGREHPKTYKFINDFEAHENIPIVRLGNSMAFHDMLAKDDFKRIPNMQMRECTSKLKVKTARKWCRENIGMTYINMIGFRADEPQRIHRHKESWKKVTTKFPLYEKGITRHMVNEFWESKPYNLEIPNILGNCTLCFMKGKNAIINILRQYPELADEWIEDEKRSAKHYGHTYLYGITIEQCLKIAQMPDLFTEVNLDDVESAFNCSCTT